ncbi:polysaccharide deacetylase family protein [Desulfovibrio piger]|nr:polysaccharide deacetylase family protein [Desulfovibrio piger]
MSVTAFFPRRARRLWTGFLSCAVGLTLCAGSAGAQVYDGNAIMRQPMRENLCALTFDDGPSRYTPHILDVLRENGIPATFFMLGKNVKLYPQHVQRIVAEGHEVGNHSFSHPNLRRISRDRKQEEIEITDKLLRDLGANPIYMRPPYGSYDKDVVDIAGRLGVTVVLWSVDSQDWKRRPANYAHIINAVGRVFPPGEMRGILLFHDPLKTTAGDLPKIISDLKAGGCQRFVTVSEYINSVLDPEPPLLWTERSPAQTPPNAVAAEQESEALMPPESYASTQRSWPAGSAPLPLARSSRPWPEEAAAAVSPPLMPSRVASHAPESLYTPSDGMPGEAPQVALPSSEPRNAPTRTLASPLPDRHGLQPISDGIGPQS